MSRNESFPALSVARISAHLTGAAVEICPDDIDDVSFAGSARHIDAIAKMVKILGNAGLEEAGEAPDLTEKKIMRSMRPNDFASAVNACVNAMNEGMVSEIPAEKPEGPVDVTLEEMNKKKETES